MSIEQTLLNEIEESQRALNGLNDDIIYRRNQSIRIELINWVLDNMKNSEVICELMENKMNDVILKINQTHDIFEADKLHSDLAILDWIFYQVCKDEQKKLLDSL